MSSSGGGGGGGGGEHEAMEEDEPTAAAAAAAEEEMEVVEREKEKVVLMWGYLPGASPQRSPLLQSTAVRLPENYAGDTWRNVCGGGCGFAMAVTDSGMLLTWGSTNDMGQSYLTSGKHEETPEAFPVPTEFPIVHAAAGWAHCAAITDHGELFTWGWKECVPSGRVLSEHPMGGSGASSKDDRPSASLSDQESRRSHASRMSSMPGSGGESKGSEESTKRRKISSKQGSEGSASSDETLSAPPCLVTFSLGIKIAAVAAGGRHTLALSDAGHVWGWGYGGEGQLGLGSRIRIVSSPHPVSCIDHLLTSRKESCSSDGAQAYGAIGSCVKAIACGGRHSAVLTAYFNKWQHPLADTGAVLTFGWGLYGQCGQGSTDDELSPICVSSLLGVQMRGIAAGLWHTICTSITGDVYSFGGNQFGQLGTDTDQAETLPKLLDGQSLENKNVKAVSCGARHNAVITDDGEVFCWGWNKYGQLGLGDSVDRSTPNKVPIADNCTPKNVSCGWWHTMVLAESSP